MSTEKTKKRKRVYVDVDPHAKAKARAAELGMTLEKYLATLIKDDTDKNQNEQDENQT